VKVHLMHADRDLGLGREPPPHAEALKQDLELATVLDEMATGDPYLRDVAERVLVDGLLDPREIGYRQRVLADCLEQPAIVRRLYDLAVEGVETKRRAGFFWYRESPDAMLQKSHGMLALLLGVLRRLRSLAVDNAGAFHSEGFAQLFSTLQRELDDAYLDELERHLETLRFRRGVLVSASLGRGNRGAAYVLRRPPERSLLERLGLGGPPAHSFTIPARDDHGLHALSQLRGRGIALVAGALAQSTDHVMRFFAALQAELGFYVACLNLCEKLREKDLPTCMPEALPADALGMSARGLVDPALAFHLDGVVVGNDVDGDGAGLVMVTGANQGGKSTFLRSVGLAQLLMQAGAVVPAASFRAAVRSGVFTHFPREEDATMTRGKLEEELQRMSDIAGRIRPGGLLLCNESFASTNEREGSEIGRHVIRAMVEVGVSVIFVTHLFDLASSLGREADDTALFLRAERRPDGTRTFRLVPGAPLPTSHAEDSYVRVFSPNRRPVEQAPPAQT
jgi:hypothetical protein